MDAQKLTQKSLEAVKNAQNLAIYMQIENLHLAYVLLAADENGLIPQLLRQMQVATAALLQAAKSEIEKLPKVTGPGREPDKLVRVSRDCDQVLNEAELGIPCRTSMCRWNTSSSPSSTTPAPN